MSPRAKETTTRPGIKVDTTRALFLAEAYREEALRHPPESDEFRQLWNTADHYAQLSNGGTP